MTETLKPAPGKRVRDPATGEPLPPKGAPIERTPFWNRRIEDGDVIVVSPKTKEA